MLEPKPISFKLCTTDHTRHDPTPVSKLAADGKGRGV